jgi:hypothetical protein
MAASYWIEHPTEHSFISALSPDGVEQLLILADNWPRSLYIIREHRITSPPDEQDVRWGYAVKDRDGYVQIAPHGEPQEPLSSGRSPRRRRSRADISMARAGLIPTCLRGDYQWVLEGLSREMQCQLGYRIAYVEANRLAKRARFDHGWGREFVAGAGADSGSIEWDAFRRVSSTICPRLVELAVRDAVEQRTPRKSVACGCRRPPRHGRPVTDSPVAR